MLNSALVVQEHPTIIQLSYGMEQANTYLMIENHHAIVIDVCSENVVEEIIRRNVRPDYVILTHEHVDHLWGLNAFRKQFPDVKIIAQSQCSKDIGNFKTNMAAQYYVYAVIRYGNSYENEEARNRKYCCEPADIIFTDFHEFQWCNHSIKLYHTPGHSAGSSIIFLDNDSVFSGDTVLEEDTFLKFDGGDEKQFACVTLPLLNKISLNMHILPGHGKPFWKRDWK